MATQLERLLAAPDISDFTDFPDHSVAPGLRALDDALRCDICRDFYDAPVALNCGHSFCSVCIRSALPQNPTCPTCRKDASEIHLRKNVTAESAVYAWKTARSLILRLAIEEHERKTRPKPPVSRTSHSREPPRKRRRSNSPAGLSDDDVVIVPSSPAPSGSATPDTLPDTVDCPICEKPVQSQYINMHIDSGCKRHVVEPTAQLDPKGKQKQQWSRILGGGTSSGASTKGKGKGKGKLRTKENVDDPGLEHLPKVAYDIHPQKRITEMLNEWGLPTHGDKNALVRRHSRWVVLYNANVDRAPEHRRTVEQLRADLRAEEAEHKTRKETVDDPVAYQKANRATFAQLTEAARPKKPASVTRREVASLDTAPFMPELAAVPSVEGNGSGAGRAEASVVEIDSS
ncbi:hypothetical protein C8Q77DRAFT_1155241 [Trametes polyzona]|nr:hypothetical protein C8Q77DRAFT_1155241 [Trametes polyzona]